MSHSGSGSNSLYALLGGHSRIMGIENNNIYQSDMSLFSVSNMKHKLTNSSRMYLDHILYNFQYSLKPNIWVKMIFLVREPEASIDYMVNRKLFKKSEAKRYYLYRIRRICELAKRNPDSVFLTYSNLREGKGLTEIADHIGIKEKISFSQEFIVPSGNNTLKSQDYDELSDCYNKYLYYASRVGTRCIK